MTDIHFGADKEVDGHCKKLPTRALSLLRYMVTRTNSEFRPDFVVQMGNLIEDEEQDVDIENYDTAVSAFRPQSMPVHHLVGDCEQVNMDLDHIRKRLGYEKLYYSFDSGDLHFVVLFATAKNHTKIHVDKEQRKWLAEDLAATEKKTIVFTHHPIDDQDLAGNQYYEESPENCFVEERAEIRQILNKSGKVRAVFSGHVHRNNLQVLDGIPYVTIQSLVENMSDSRKVPSESYALVLITDDEIKVDIQGIDPAEYRLSPAEAVV